MARCKNAGECFMYDDGAECNGESCYRSPKKKPNVKIDIIEKRTAIYGVRRYFWELSTEHYFVRGILSNKHRSSAMRQARIVAERLGLEVTK